VILGCGRGPYGAKRNAGGQSRITLRSIRATREREEDVIALVAIGLLLAIWAVVLLFSIFFSQNMQA
jgi:hypothetical protein